MPRGDKGKYTDKQKRQAEHIEEGYEDRGLSEKESERRAWATVNKMTGGGKKSGSGRGKKVNKEPAKKGGRIGGAAQKGKKKTKRAATKRAATKKTTAKKSTAKKTTAKKSTSSRKTKRKTARKKT